MSTAATPKLAPGQKAPPFTLPDQNPLTRGGSLSLSEILSGKKGAVVMWMCNHCPYVVGAHERITALAQATMTRGLGWAAISSNDPTNYPEDAPEKMHEYALAWNLPFPYLFDGTQNIARSYGAERTPEIFLLDAHGVCVYEGAFDDSPRDASKVTDRPLAEAIEDLLSGRPVRRARTAAIGCTIKWKP